MVGKSDIDLIDENQEFAAHPAWRFIETRLNTLKLQMLERAARAVGDEHHVRLGQLEGVEATIGLLRLIRNEMKGKSE